MQRQTPAGFGIQMTPLTKQVLIALFTLFVLQVITYPGSNWAPSLPWPELVWQANAERLQPWQPLTHWFVQSMDLWVLVNWLMVLFFLPPTEESYGKRGVLTITLVLVSTCAVTGTLGAMTNNLNGAPASGILPIITAFITLFAFNRPNATILLAFVFPVRGIWIAWGTGLIAFLSFILSRDLSSTLYLTAWCTAYGWVKLVDSGRMRRFFLRRKEKQIEKRLSRFQVHEGGGEISKPRGWGHDPNEGDDGPIVH